MILLTLSFVDLHALGDQDLRTLPNLGDHDMRIPPSLGIDKDMRQPMGDQDLRTIGVPTTASEPRPFDPRFRNIQGPDRNTIPGFDRPRPSNVDPRTAHDPRNPAIAPRVEDPRKASLAASIVCLLLYYNFLKYVILVYYLEMIAQIFHLAYLFV